MEALKELSDAMSPDPTFVSHLKNDLLNRLSAKIDAPATISKPKSLGAAVREARKRLRLSLAEAARRLGLAEEALSNLESDYLPRSEVSDLLVSTAERVFSLPGEMLRRLRSTLPVTIPESMGKSEQYEFARRKNAAAPEHPPKGEVEAPDSGTPKQTKDLFNLFSSKTEIDE
jgi:transcriptional regulator with XRE-family HTH domain